MLNFLVSQFHILTNFFTVLMTRNHNMEIYVRDCHGHSHEKDQSKGGHVFFPFFIINKLEKTC